MLQLLRPFLGFAFVLLVGLPEAVAADCAPENRVRIDKNLDKLRAAERAVAAGDLTETTETYIGKIYDLVGLYPGCWSDAESILERLEFVYAQRGRHEKRIDPIAKKGRNYLKEKRFEEAEKTFKKMLTVIELFRRDEDPEQDRFAKKYLLIGAWSGLYQALYRQGKYEPAAAYAKKVREIARDYSVGYYQVRALYDLGFIYEKLERPVVARKYRAEAKRLQRLSRE